MRIGRDLGEFSTTRTKSQANPGKATGSAGQSPQEAVCGLWKPSPDLGGAVAARGAQAARLAATGEIASFPNPLDRSPALSIGWVALSTPEGALSSNDLRAHNIGVFFSLSIRAKRMPSLPDRREGGGFIRKW